MTTCLLCEEETSIPARWTPPDEWARPLEFCSYQCMGEWWWGEENIYQGKKEQ